MTPVTHSTSSSAKAVRNAPHAALNILALGVIVAVLYLGRVLFITSLAALMIAFILEPFVGLLMRIRFPRSLASFVVCAFALAVLYMIGLGAYSQLSGVYDDLPKYAQSIGNIVDTVQQRIAAMEESTYRMLVPARQRADDERRRQQEQAALAARKGKRGAPPAPAVPPGPAPIPEVRIHEETSPVADYIYQHLGGVYQSLLMVSFIPFLVYFMLSWRDHINRSFLQ
ncbi:MAG: AI-2E family transporter, partial [Acidobacteriota bacterium]|nr:AI-2E family transporter [Acidobacteriota bacterium]